MTIHAIDPRSTDNETTMTPITLTKPTLATTDVNAVNLCEAFLNARYRNMCDEASALFVVGLPDDALAAQLEADSIERLLYAMDNDNPANLDEIRELHQCVNITDNSGFITGLLNSLETQLH